MKIDNTISEVNKVLLERIRSPFLAAFAISWVAFNWDSIFFILFSDSIAIDKILYAKLNSSIWEKLVYPLIIAGIYVAGLPYVYLGLDWIRLKGVKKRLENKKDETIDQLIRENDIAKEKKKLEEERASQKSLETLNDEIEALQNQLDRKQQELSNVRGNYRSLRRSTVKVITLLEEKYPDITSCIDDGYVRDIITQNPDPNSIKDPMSIRTLLEFDLVEKNKDSQEYVYTEKGDWVKTIYNTLSMDKSS